MVWLHELRKIGAEVEVCHVVSIGAKSNRLNWLFYCTHSRLTDTFLREINVIDGKSKLFFLCHWWTQKPYIKCWANRRPYPTQKVLNLYPPAVSELNVYRELQKAGKPVVVRTNSHPPFLSASQNKQALANARSAKEVTLLVKISS